MKIKGCPNFFNSGRYQKDACPAYEKDDNAVVVGVMQNVMPSGMT